MDKKFAIINAEIVSEIIRKPHIEAEEYENFLYYSDNEYPHKLIVGQGHVCESVKVEFLSVVKDKHFFIIFCN